MTEIRIPVRQTIATSNSYPAILLEGFLGEEGDIDLEAGQSITGTIAPNGTITIQDWYGTCVYSDASGTQSLGWYNCFEAGVILRKN